MVLKRLTLRRITDTGGADYDFAERLLTDSFPPEERRDIAAWRSYTHGKSHFHNMLVCDDDAPVALVTYWHFDSFCYVEHFAVSAALRSCGYGGRILSLLQSQLSPLPIVLEVELPDTEISRRRIDFYRHNGFSLLPADYRQPPYRPGDASIPMHLMANMPLSAEQISAARRAIYKDVYGVE
jgi:ribosomal protein S18 acetylase RimI-like enzyme